MRLGVAVLVVAVLAVLFCSSQGGLATPSFVTKTGSNLYLDGQPFTFTGLNIYNANSDGWCWYQMNSGPALDDALTAIGPGKGVIRSWFFQPLGTTGGVRDWSGFDHTLAVAAAHGYRVIATLTDQWGECGAGADPGETSYFKTKDWYVSGYAAPEPGMPTSYRDWVAEVVTRYKDNPNVLMWQLINEAEVQEFSGAECPPGDEPRDVLIDWASDVSALVKSIDQNHLVSLGTIGGGQCGTQGSQYQDVHAIATIDVCEYHDYGDSTPIPGDQWNGLQVRIDQCNALGKPLIVGEMGVLPNGVGGTLQARADVIRAKKQAQMDAGIDGVLAWAWSNLGSTLDNYDIGANDPALEALILSDNCPNDANPGQENMDGDAWGDACDPCPSFASFWTVPTFDDDCDGFTTTNENEIGTDPNLPCPATGVNVNPPGANDEPLPDRWPVDFNDNQIVNTIDVGFYVPRLNAVDGEDPEYDIRFDLSFNGVINTVDVGRFVPFLNKSCTP